MSLDAVIEKIRAAGDAEIDAIRKEGAAERERMLADARKEGAALKADRLAAAESAGERLKTQELAKAELQAKKITLAAQKEILDRVLETARDRLAASPRRAEVIRALLAEYKDETASGRVLAHEEDAAVVRSSGLAPPATLDCLGGLVIESADGSRRVDLRFETILEGVWRDSVRQVADILWREGEG